MLWSPPIRYGVRALSAWLLLGCASGLHAQMQAVDARFGALAGRDAQVLILFFVASDCPISNRYFPEMTRIAREFAPQHVAVRYVYPNAGEQPTAVAAHQRDFDAAPAAATLDRDGVLVHSTGVTTTPEAALLVRAGDHWREVYHGRIDDRYVRFGVERSAVEHHDAEDAVRAVLQHRSVPHPDGPPVGCGIVPASFLHEAGR